MSFGARPLLRILVTGFGPFPGVEQNASASVVRALTLSTPLPGIELFAEVIPVDWTRARTVARDAIARVKPHAVLHFGVSKRVTGFEIETRAVNMSGPKPDQAGAARPGSPLSRSGMPVLYPVLPPATLLRALRLAGIRAQLSRSAGRYLCNALYYWSLADADANGALVTFVHMPAIGIEAHAKSCLTFEHAVAGAQVLVRASAQAVLCAKRGFIGKYGRRGSHGSQVFHGAGRNGRAGRRECR
jgi:pyroglutamyl-peptidase